MVLTRETSRLAPAGFRGFEIRSSDEDVAKIGRRIARSGHMSGMSCRNCATPADRRFGYAFTNCTHCGPRYTIIEDIPYDRPRTTMRAFAMCPECQREYTDPADRRFHAQPMRARAAGPRLWAEPNGTSVDEPAIERAAQTILGGGIVATEGHWRISVAGGCATARSRGASAHTQASRREAIRADDAFARHGARVLPRVAGRGAVADVGRRAHRAACDRTANPGSHANVAGSSPYIGVMLPYSPLHHLLMESLPVPPGGHKRQSE